jgi:hypothetical protein
LLRLIDALGRDEIDLVAFTTASQASNLFAVAQYDGKEASLQQSLCRTLVASIGPVCSAALRALAREGRYRSTADEARGVYCHKRRRDTCPLGLPWEFDPRMKLKTG